MVLATKETETDLEIMETVLEAIQVVRVVTLAEETETTAMAMVAKAMETETVTNK